jgi:hypothetical protein
VPRPMPDPKAPSAPGYFHVLAKAAGPICNLVCDYRFSSSQRDREMVAHPFEP